jgi:hypothetical protein
VPALGQEMIERVSLGPGGVESNGYSEEPALSADGRFVAFISSAGNLVPGDTNYAQDVFVHDRGTRVTQRVNVGPNGRQANGAPRSRRCRRVVRRFRIGGGQPGLRRHQRVGCVRPRPPDRHHRAGERRTGRQSG